MLGHVIVFLLRGMPVQNACNVAVMWLKAGMPLARGSENREKATKRDVEGGQAKFR